MKYKIGDWIIFIDKEMSDKFRNSTGISLYKKLAKIIYIIPDNEYLLEFKDPIGNDHNGDGRGKKGHCGWCVKSEFKSAINHLKFKKWIKG